MANKSQPEPTVKAIKQCLCGATVFQGPFNVGEIDQDGAMRILRVEYRCVNCNKVQSLEQMIDREIAAQVI